MYNLTNLGLENRSGKSYSSVTVIFKLLSESKWMLHLLATTIVKPQTIVSGDANSGSWRASTNLVGSKKVNSR